MNSLRNSKRIMVAKEDVQFYLGINQLAYFHRNIYHGHLTVNKSISSGFGVEYNETYIIHNRNHFLGMFALN